ncbi:MAG: hypothetical protein RIT81_30930 [Deltaproteobacteria bacterium]
MKCSGAHLGLVFCLIVGCTRPSDVPDGIKWVAAIALDDEGGVADGSELVLAEVAGRDVLDAEVLVGFGGQQLALDSSSPAELRIEPALGCGPYLPRPEWVSGGRDTIDFEDALEASWFHSRCADAPTLAELHRQDGISAVAIQQTGCRFTITSSQGVILTTGAMGRTGFGCFDTGSCETSSGGAGFRCGDACCGLAGCHAEATFCPAVEGGRCRRLAWDSDNCGACDVVCDAGWTCKDGVCQEPPVETPPDGRAVKVVVGENRACALTVDSRVFCWEPGRRPQAVAGGMDDLLLLGNSDILCVLGEGQVLCDHEVRGQLSWIASGAETFFGYFFNELCVYRGTEVECKEPQEFGSSRSGAPPGLTLIRAELQRYVGIDQSQQLHAFRSSGSVWTLPGYTDVTFSSYDELCAVAVDGTVDCFDFETGEVTSTLDLDLMGISSYGSATCGWGSSGLWCWGNLRSAPPGFTGEGPLLIPETEGTTASSFNRRTGCIVDAAAQVRCWGADSTVLGNDRVFGVPVRVPLRRRATHLFAEVFRVCARTEDRETVCWGNGVGVDALTGRGVVVVPSGTDYIAEGWVACVHSASTALECVLFRGGVSERNARLDKFHHVDIGGAGLCAVGDEGGVSVCLPSETQVQGVPRRARLVASDGAACAIVDRRVVCGQPRQEPNLSSWAPRGPGAANDLALMSSSLCVASDKGLFCERDGATTQLRAGAFRSVRAGFFAGCGIDASDRAWCFGVNDYGMVRPTRTRRDEHYDFLEPTEVPLGPVHAIVGGFENVCALLGDGSVYCWGSNSQCQLGRCDAYHQRLAPPIVLE